MNFIEKLYKKLFIKEYYIMEATIEIVEQTPHKRKYQFHRSVPLERATKIIKSSYNNNPFVIINGIKMVKKTNKRDNTLPYYN